MMSTSASSWPTPPSIISVIYSLSSTLLVLLFFMVSSLSELSSFGRRLSDLLSEDEEATQLPTSLSLPELSTTHHGQSHSL